MTSRQVSTQAVWRCCLLLVFALSFLAGCSVNAPQGDHWLGEDKLKHFTVSAVIAAAATEQAEQQALSDCEGARLSVGVVLSIGAGKEWYDQNIKGTYWSYKDMVWNLAGALVGSAVAGECY